VLPAPVLVGGKITPYERLLPDEGKSNWQSHAQRHSFPDAAAVVECHRLAGRGGQPLEHFPVCACHRQIRVGYTHAISPLAEIVIWKGAITRSARSSGSPLRSTALTNVNTVVLARYERKGNHYHAVKAGSWLASGLRAEILPQVHTLSVYVRFAAKFALKFDRVVSNANRAASPAASRRGSSIR